MKYNIEKINQIGKLLAEVVEEALKTDGEKEALIGDVEMDSLPNESRCENQPRISRIDANFSFPIRDIIL